MSIRKYSQNKQLICCLQYLEQDVAHTLEVYCRGLHQEQQRRLKQAEQQRLAQLAQKEYQLEFKKFDVQRTVKRLYPFKQPAKQQWYTNQIAKSYLKANPGEELGQDAFRVLAQFQGTRQQLPASQISQRMRPQIDRSVVSLVSYYHRSTGLVNLNPRKLFLFYRTKVRGKNLMVDFPSELCLKAQLQLYLGGHRAKMQRQIELESRKARSKSESKKETSKSKEKKTSTQSRKQFVERMQRDVAKRSRQKERREKQAKEQQQSSKSKGKLNMKRLLALSKSKKKAT